MDVDQLLLALRAEDVAPHELRLERLEPQLLARLAPQRLVDRLAIGHMAAHGRIPPSGLDILPGGALLEVEPSVGVEQVEVDHRMEQHRAAVALAPPGRADDAPRGIDHGKELITVVTRLCSNARGRMLRLRVQVRIHPCIHRFHWYYPHRPPGIRRQLQRQRLCSTAAAPEPGSRPPRRLGRVEHLFTAPRERLDGNFYLAGDTLRSTAIFRFPRRIRKRLDGYFYLPGYTLYPTAFSLLLSPPPRRIRERHEHDAGARIRADSPAAADYRRGPDSRGWPTS